MRNVASALALGCLLAASAAAAWRDLSASDFDVPPPPSRGSADDAADLSTLLADQNSRTPEQCALARSMKIPDFTSLYSASGLLSPEEMSAVRPFVDQASNLASSISGVFKREYARPRPYNEDPRIQPCVDKPGGNAAYPSTHATVGAVDACVLSAIFPDRAEKLAAYGRSIGDLRVISGVHHPTDVTAGRALAAGICGRLEQDGDFRAEVAALKKRLNP